MNRIVCAKVAVSNLNFSVDKEFSYLIPQNITHLVVPGVRVVVPFGRANKKREGIVTQVFFDEGAIPLKSICELVDYEPVIDEKGMELAHYISRRYYATLYDSVSLMLPPGSNLKFTECVKLLDDSLENVSDETGIRRKILDYLVSKRTPVLVSELEEAFSNKGIKKVLTQLQSIGKLEIFEESRQAHQQKSIQIAELLLDEHALYEYIDIYLKKAHAQRRVLEMLLENGRMPVVDLVAFSGASRGSITALQKKGVIEITEEIVEQDPFSAEKTATQKVVNLNESQSQVVAQVLSARKEGTFREFLLKGVTGSGKTEVYLALVEQVIAEGKQAIVLVPEIALTPQIRERFFRRFGEKVAVLHSALSISERKDQWNKIKNGQVSVAVGARSAVFAPFSNLDLIIVDEEHETTYKSEHSPRYHAKDVARFLMKQRNGTLLLASATPSVEDYYRAEMGEATLLTLSGRYQNRQLPQVEIVDMREELKNGNHSVLSESLKKRLLEVKEKGEKAIILLNRRGYSTFVSCRDCGYVVKCKKCDVAMTYHSIEGQLKCHYCGATQAAETVCPECKSTSVRYFGSGTQKLEEEIYRMFSDTQVIRMDNDTTTTKMSHERLLKQFAKPGCSILLGTQMIAKGLDFKEVSLVGVISADSSLFVGGYNGAEKTFSLITQVCGRAGRGEIPGYAVVQTYHPEHYAILAAKTQDYENFYQNEIVFRKQVKYPPFSEIINVIFTGTDEKKIFSMADGIKKIMTEKVDFYKEREQYIAMYGPVPCGISKIRNQYRYHILIKCTSATKVQTSFSEAVKTLILANKANDITVVVDVNPVNFL
ncbi:MAG: primosomal protein N' [Clostridia bacterium]|nr:primosomal protein N' [Clostridia bacterium]